MLNANEAIGMPSLDTTNCDREPIHIPGSIQPHGILVVLAEADQSIIQLSENTDRLLGVSPNDALGRPLGYLVGTDVAEELTSALIRAQAGNRPIFLRTVKVAAAGSDRVFHAIAHRNEGGIILELERDQNSDPTPDIHPLVDAFMLAAEAASSIVDLAQVTAREIRQLTGFDRVLVYRFDQGWHGTVIGEDGNGRLPSLLNHRFPASDIPAQARNLYVLNRVRIIPDAAYHPVPVTPADNAVTGKPLDMSFSTLRSVSPVHVEYMKNMETASSMSVSILRDGKLWGLISCHHKNARFVPFTTRGTCDLFARAFSLRLSALEHSHEYERRIKVRSVFAKLVAVMSDRGDFASALAEHPQDLLEFADARGAAVLAEGHCLLFGETPAEEQVRGLADWLFGTVKEDVYSTDSLPSVYPTAHPYKNTASGLLAAAISKLHPSYVLWFRPEVIRTIQWGGDPHKPVESNGDRMKLHPRRSFETWRETVRDRSVPWESSEVEGARNFRNTIVGTVLRKAEELAALNADLTRSNKELEAFSYSVSHDLRAPLRHIVGYAEMLKEGGAGRFTERDERYITTIIESSEYAGRLVDKLLGYSRLGRAELHLVQVNMNILVRETQEHAMTDAAGRDITWKIADLPTVVADLMMLRMAVRDLLSNAVKYTRDQPAAVIEVASRDEGAEYVFLVKDNGVGFDMEYVDKLFGVFQRLHRWEEYEGTGIGLANVRRVVERHGGRTWAYGEEGKGATFFFTLPKPPPDNERKAGC